MAKIPNRLERFWYELKRRRVFGVVTTYVATAYIIIEVTNNLAAPLHLTELFLTLELSILALGLPVAVVLSWIFDLTPFGIMKTGSPEGSEKSEIQPKPVAKRLRPSHILNAVLIVIVIVLAYPKIFKRNTLEKLRSSGEKIYVAVMPFQNLTGDTIWNIWQTGIQNELTTFLTNSEELKVRQTELVNKLIQVKGFTNFASITPSFAGTISQQIDATVFVYGTIKKAGSTVRVNAQLIDSETNDSFTSFQIDGTEENILHITDSLAVMVENSLVISKLMNKLPLYQRHRPTTSSSEAYRYFLYGENAQSARDYKTAKKMFLQALAIDSNFVFAALSLSYVCMNEGSYEEGRTWSDKVYNKRDQMPTWMKILADRNHASFYETPVEEIKYLRQYLEFDDHYPGTYYNIGLNYSKLDQYDKAIPEYEKSMKLYDKFGTKPWWIFNYTQLGEAYHETGQYKKEKKLYKKADRDFPDDPAIIWYKTVLSLTERDTITANNYIEKYKVLRRDRSWTDAGIAYSIGEIYNKAGYLGKAEKYHRLELSFEPEDPYRMWDLAWFLIDRDRNINEGMELVNKALELKPDTYWFLDTKGWGLYKQGKYKEALELLERSRDLCPFYRHQVYLHLEAAKNAVASQKNN
jgi:tetratricopeptide (TPR) repeat protein/TolB-like protein